MQIIRAVLFVLLLIPAKSVSIDTQIQPNIENNEIKIKSEKATDLFITYCNNLIAKDILNKEHLEAMLEKEILSNPLIAEQQVCLMLYLFIESSLSTY